MIQLTRLNGTVLWLNPLLVETIEATPDSVVTLTNGHKYIVCEDEHVIRHAMTEFYRAIGLVRGALHEGEE